MSRETNDIQKQWTRFWIIVSEGAIANITFSPLFCLGLFKMFCHVKTCGNEYRAIVNMYTKIDGSFMTGLKNLQAQVLALNI